ncbi:MAG: hypothetical protein IPL79_20085 [Myxococcales bacterium]|nr:hypothetical protein [Myxococcales bacterium]
MVHLIILIVFMAASFASGYWLRHRRGVVLDIKKAVAGLAQLRDDGKVDPEAANRLILLARAERKKARKHGSN